MNETQIKDVIIDMIKSEELKFEINYDSHWKELYLTILHKGIEISNTTTYVNPKEDY